MLKTSFRPEFLNRLDEIVFYRPLTKADLIKIIDLLIADLEKRLANRQLKVTVTDKAKEYIVETGSDPVYGARPLKRYIQSKVETLLARRIIADDAEPGSTLVIDKNEDGLFVR
ncbi:Chaperone protein ClpB [bioreactor metagenome]|uniref:Chaperone protein ClpB n=1 Tax=bioreactor metagenome TaxID=1076179 RepID=A0A644ZFQ5_9ZZZZ